MWILQYSHLCSAYAAALAAESVHEIDPDVVRRRVKAPPCMPLRRAAVLDLRVGTFCESKHLLQWPHRILDVPAGTSGGQSGMYTFRRREEGKEEFQARSLLACIVRMTTTTQVEKILYDIAAPLNINEAEFLELMDNSIVSSP